MNRKNGGQMDFEVLKETLRSVGAFGNNILQKDALDDIVYNSLVDLLVRGTIVYSVEKDTFLLRKELDD